MAAKKKAATKKRASTPKKRTTSSSVSRASGDVVIRAAKPKDCAAAGKLGASLAKMHHEWDEKRFFVVDDSGEGYAWWLRKEAASKNAVVLVAERAGEIVGYAYGRVEPRDWNSLRDRCGVAVDLIVRPDVRKHGVGKKLANALVDALKAKKVPFVVLGVAANNHNAQQFFASLGARPVMIEMQLDVD